MSKKREKDLYKQLEQQVAAAYQNASDEDKARIDALRQTIYNYRGADPMNNRDARRLYIDGYQRMLDLASGGSGYDPTRLGDAVTNEWGYYSPDEITNIGNQLAYSLFHGKQPQQGSTAVISSVGGGNDEGSVGNSDWKHTTFQWNKGMMDPGYFTSTTTKKQKVEAFASQLAENLREVLNKRSDGYIVHGLNDLSQDIDIQNAIQILESAKQLDWDNPSNETDQVFQSIGQLASRLKIDPADIAAYFDIDGSTLTDPADAERAAALKQLGLKDVSRSGIDAGALAYIDKNKWQLLQDDNGIIRVYDNNFEQVPVHAYLQDDPGASDRGTGFFINQNGQYLYIPKIEEFTDWNNQDFGPLVNSAIEARRSQRDYKNIGTYDPYHSYVSNTNPEDTSMEQLLDKISESIGSSNFKFIDMSGYFRGDEAVIGVPLQGQIQKDYLGNIQFDPNMPVYKLDANGNLVPTTFQQASSEGYYYSGYGNEGMSQYKTYDLLSNVEENLNNPDITNFNFGDNMWGINGWQRMMNGYGKDSTKELTLNNAPEWATMVMGMILDPQGKSSFGGKSIRNLDVLIEMGYNPNNPLPFIQGFYLFLKQHKLLDKVNKTTMRKVLRLAVPASSVEQAQMGTVLDYNNAAYKRKKDLDIPSELTDESSARKIDPNTGESELSGVALTRMISLGADLGSLVAAFFPGAGTVVSGALGVGSTLTNFGADIAEDGIDGKDLGRLLLNLGLDAVGLVGGTGKIPKIMRTIGTLYPTLWGAFGLMKNGDQYKKILEKTQRGQTLTLQDWQLLAQGVQILVSGARGVKSHVTSKKVEKLKAIKDSGTSADAKYVIKGTDAAGNERDITLTKSQLEKIASAKAQAEVKGTKKKPGTPAKTGYEAANDELHKIPEYKDVNLTPSTKKEKWYNKPTESTDNPLYGFDYSKPSIPAISQSTYNNAVNQLMEYRRGVIFNKDGIITLPTKKDGGKFQRLQSYINQK